ncbi:MAG: hypothetical protein WCW93_03860 [Candidatus Paceibacterota bacterium]|jgi:hypothetical protein
MINLPLPYNKLTTSGTVSPFGFKWGIDTNNPSLWTFMQSQLAQYFSNKVTHDYRSSPLIFSFSHIYAHAGQTNPMPMDAPKTTLSRGLHLIHVAKAMINAITI